MRQLDRQETAKMNEVIGHCQNLINLRGRHEERFWQYENAPFAIWGREDADGFNLQVNYSGRSVLRLCCDWDGHQRWTVFEPGPWRAELLRVPAAHA